jgi:hypothetical protein
MKYPAAVTREKFPPWIKALLVTFFLNITRVMSGARNETRHLPLSKHDVDTQLYAQWPKLLRQAAKQTPCLLVAPTDNRKEYTKFECSVRAAMWSAQQTMFDQDAEYHARWSASNSAYLRKLQRNQLRRKIAKISDLKVSDKDLDEMLQQGPVQDQEHKLPSPATQPKSKQGNIDINLFDPSTYDIRPPDPDSFWKFIHDQKIRYTTKKYLHECPLHKKGPVWEAEDLHIQTELRKLEAEQASPLTTEEQNLKRNLESELATFAISTKLDEAQANAKAVIGTHTHAQR